MHVLALSGSNIEFPTGPVCCCQRFCVCLQLQGCGGMRVSVHILCMCEQNHYFLSSFLEPNHSFSSLF